MTAWIADVLTVVGLIVMTLGVYGIAQAAYQREPMRAPAAIDESAPCLPRPPLHFSDTT